MKTQSSCLVILSPMVNKAMREIKKGFSRIKSTLLAAMIFIAVKISRAENVSPNTLTVTYGNYSLDTPLKNDVLFSSPVVRKKAL